MSQIQIIEYSTRSIVVSGDTKSIKTDLMKLGGKWNSKLKSSPGKGWVFPKTKQTQVEKFLDSGDDVKINDEPIISPEEQIKNLEKLLTEKDEIIAQQEDIISELKTEKESNLNELSHFARIYDDLMQEHAALCEPDEEDLSAQKVQEEVSEEVTQEEVPQEEVPQEIQEEEVVLEEVQEEDLESEIKYKTEELSKMKLKEIKMRWLL